MSEKETIIDKLERGRAEFAYRCADEGKRIKKKQPTQIDGEYYQDDKYASYVKNLPQMILNNGLGMALAFILSKRKKEKREGGLTIQPGSKENPKNAYDLIYKQLTEYMGSNSTARIKLPNNKDLTEWVISCASSEYRYITQEILAFLNWAKRLAEGLIETEGEVE